MSQDPIVKYKNVEEIIDALSNEEQEKAREIQTQLLKEFKKTNNLTKDNIESILKNYKIYKTSILLPTGQYILEFIITLYLGKYYNRNDKKIIDEIVEIVNYAPNLFLFPQFQDSVQNYMVNIFELLIERVNDNDLINKSLLDLIKKYKIEDKIFVLAIQNNKLQFANYLTKNNLNFKCFTTELITHSKNNSLKNALEKSYITFIKNHNLECVKICNELNVNLWTEKGVTSNLELIYYLGHKGNTIYDYLYANSREFNLYNFFLNNPTFIDTVFSNTQRILVNNFITNFYIPLLSKSSNYILSKKYYDLLTSDIINITSSLIGKYKYELDGRYLIDQMRSDFASRTY